MSSQSDQNFLKQRHQITKHVTLIGALVNLIVSLLQIIFGWLSYSQALLADGVHTLSDLISDFLVLAASAHAQKQPDEDHPFGHARIETLASVALGLLLIFVAISIAIRGAFSVLDQNNITPDSYALFFAAIAIFSKEILFRYTLNKSKLIHSALLESNAWHHRSDVFSSLVVFAGIGGQLLGIAYLDIAAAFIVALMILKMGFKLSIKAFKELIDTALEPKTVKQIEDCIQAVNGVFHVHQLRTRSMGGLGYVDVDIEVNPKISISEGHFIATQVETSVKQQFNQIQDIKIHIEPFDHDDIHQQMNDFPTREKLLFNLYSALDTVHSSEIIKNVNIHYLPTHIEVDIILPIDMSKQKHQTSVQAIKNATLGVKFIEQINIYFT